MILIAAQILSARRLRLFFDATLGAGAFTATGLYRVESVNALGESPGLANGGKAFFVSSNTSALEVQLTSDLVPGGIYDVYAEGVPDGVGNVTPVGSHGTVAPGAQTAQPVAPIGNIEDADAWLYGIDLVYDTTDFVLDASGDLAEASGPPLVRRDLLSRLLSDGLPWDNAYGVKPREYIDGTPGAALALRGASIGQMLEDDRVTSCDASFGVDEGTGDAYVEVRPVLIGDASRSAIEPMKQSLTQTNV